MCFARIEYPKITIPIIPLDLVLMMDYFSRLETSTQLFLCFPTMDKFSGVNEPEISLGISIGLSGHGYEARNVTYRNIHRCEETRVYSLYLMNYQGNRTFRTSDTDHDIM